MGSPMMSASSALAGYSLLALGAIVFLTGMYMLVAMLVLGAGMIGQLFNIMMQGSTVSGIAMILVGLAMLYSGSQMTRTSREEMM
jgi:threonine/homoserine/homoserine lactone efflux protein